MSETIKFPPRPPLSEFIVRIGRQVFKMSVRAQATPVQHWETAKIISFNKKKPKPPERIDKDSSAGKA
jgi:hypothetical protein